MTLYTAISTVGGEWGFKTPYGKCIGFSAEAHASRVAAITENQDREEAKAGKGPVAELRKKHFGI